MVEVENNVQRYDAYKDSGVEWLGDIPEHWELGRLGSILNPVSSKNHPNEILLSITREKGVIVRDTENEDSNHNFIPDDLTGYKLLKKGQFGMNKMKAWQGSYGVSSYTGIVSPAYYTFEFTKEIEPRFFHIAIRSKMYVSFFGKASDGVRIGQWDLSKDRMKRIPLAVPPLPEQNAIAQFLDDKTTKIDDAIAIKEQQINLLKERKQILIHKAVTRGLDDSVTLKDSGVEWIGEIPEGWEVRQIKAVSNTVSGGTPSSGNRQRYYNGKYPWIRTTDLNNGILNEVPEYITDSALRDTACKIIPKKTICIAMYGGSGTIGKFSLVNFDNATLNQAVCGIISNRNINYLFLYYSLQMMRSHWMFYADGSRKDPNISQDVIRNMPIVFPLISEQKEISAYIETASQKIETAIGLKQQEIEKLKEYKGSLINGVVTGKVRVC